MDANAAAMATGVGALTRMELNLQLSAADIVRASAGIKPAVDVIVPVYNAADDLARCVESLLAHTPTTCRIVLIDDASPDPKIAALFADLGERALPQVRLLRNEANLGFTLTANRGMDLSRADVVLLNSDTVVTAGWLDALIRCATSDAAIGTVTPFSNNAEICSYPRFCEVNPWYGHEHMEEERAALAGAAVPSYPDIPTGVGFCLYIRRALIDAIGTFDPVFGLGYGEENDFCMRAVAAGYRNVLCDDTYVAHIGARSFEGRKEALGARNMMLLLERHPTYLDIVRAYIAADPVRAIRGAAMARQRVETGPERGVLHVIHGHGGGTEHHVRALIESSRGGYRHYLATAIGDAWQIEEHQDDGGVRAFDFRRQTEESWHDFIGGICAAFRIGLLHLHNISGCREGLLASVATLGVPYGYTVHDINFACPTITFLGVDGLYCGAQTDAAVCGQCMASQPDFAHVDIVAWRANHQAMLANAAFLIAPSHWAAATFMRYFPGRAIEVIPHGAPGVWAAQESPGEARDRRPTRLAVVLPDDNVPTVAVMGAIGPDKGARRIERMVELVRSRGVRVRFVLIGYLDVQHTPWQSDDAVFTVHGRYAPRDLPDLLAHYRVRLVAYPSAGPETFSFTLSEAWAAGRPVIVPPFGALVERISGTGAGWAWSEEEWRDEGRMLERIAQLVAPEFAPELSLAAQCARACPQPTLVAMAQRTLRLYDNVMSAAAAAPVVSGFSAPPLSAARIRDALGYAPWTPPSAPAKADPLQVAAAEPRALAPEDSLPLVPADPFFHEAKAPPPPSSAEDLVASSDAELSPLYPEASVSPLANDAAATPTPGTVDAVSGILQPALSERILRRLRPASILDAIKARLF